MSGQASNAATFGSRTEEKSARALRDTLDRSRGVKTYNLGELMFNGFPAFVTTPSRGYQQRATVTGYTPPPEFAAGMGPIVTRGLLLDVLGAKVARRQSSALGAPALNGKPVLLDNYRITIDGESIVTDELAADRLHEFAYVVTPQFSGGATAGNTPPVAIGRPRGY